MGNMTITLAWSNPIIGRIALTVAIDTPTLDEALENDIRDLVHSIDGDVDGADDLSRIVKDDSRIVKR
jgi:hypothetical protein